MRGALPAKAVGEHRDGECGYAADLEGRYEFMLPAQLRSTYRIEAIQAAVILDAVAVKCLEGVAVSRIAAGAERADRATARAFQKVWKEGGESSVIILKGLGEDKETLIHDVDFDPVTDTPRHADFYAIEKGKKVKVGVPIEFVGVSAAVKELGAILVKVLHELEIEVMPKDLPHVLEVDISPLTALGSQLLVKDLKVASGITILNKEDEVVAIASEVKDEVIDDTPVDLSAIEVEKKGKKEEEEASE